jgi:Uma2 family endonuclease
MAAEPIQRKLFTTGEYHQMLQAGILSEDDRVELIEGEIWEMSPIGSRHIWCVAYLTRILQRGLGDDVFLLVQSPLRLNDFSEPEPDFAVVRPRAGSRRETSPTAEDALLVIEVADSSVEYDRQVKMDLYARNGVPEAWLFDLTQGALEAYRSPSPEGYLIRRSGDRLSPLAFPDLLIEVDAILG